MKQNEGKVAHKNITFILINSFLIKKDRRRKEKERARYWIVALFFSLIFLLRQNNAMMNLLKNKIGSIFVHIRHQMYQRFVPEHVKKFLLTHPPNITVQCLFALCVAEIIHFVREEIKFQIWCRQGREKGGMHELTEEEIQENKRTGKVPEVDEKRMPTKDLLEEPTEEIKRDVDKLIEFINQNRRKDSSMVRVGKSTIPKAGLGLFADRDITEGERIRGATYGGRIMNFNEAKKIPMEEKDYVMALHLNVHVDAKEHYGYMARYINDTYKTEKSRNCKFLKMSVENRASVIAMRDIERGEELFAEYGSGYWRARNGEIDADRGDVENFKRDMEKAQKWVESKGKYKSKSKKTHSKEFNNAADLLEREGKGLEPDSIFKKIP